MQQGVATNGDAGEGGERRAGYVLWGGRKATARRIVQIMVGCWVAWNQYLGGILYGH